LPRRCSVCHKGVFGKTASVYIAWWPSENVRVCYLARICPNCASTVQDWLMLAAKQLKLLEVDERLSCPGCGEGLSDDGESTWLTVYLPKRDRIDAELYSCSKCADSIRVTGRDHGEKQPDRGGAEPLARAPAWDPWAALALDSA